MSSIVGPFEVSIFVHVVSETDDARQLGKVEVSLQKGVVPTIEDIHNAIGQALEGIPGEFRLLDGQEFFNELVAERFGRTRTRFAAGASWDFDVDALAESAKAERSKRKAAEPKHEARQHEEDDFDEDEDEQLN